MAAIITNLYRVYNAAQFLESVAEPFATLESANTFHYVFVGRPQPWSNEAVPTAPIDTVDMQIESFKDMIIAKRVTSSDIRHVVPREDWVTGTIYDMYDNKVSTLFPAYSGATSLFDSNFYVITDEYNVYKCLYNNNNSASTVKPTSLSLSPFTTADGYIWKYMYTLTVEEIVRFLTPEFMPVRTDTSVSSAAVNGAIDAIKVTASGTSYTSAPTVLFVGDGNSAVAATATLSSGAVSNVLVTTSANGWTACNVTLSGGGGTGAQARAIIGPPNGHGFNAPFELGAYYVMVSVNITSENMTGGTLLDNNDYRKIGMIADPTNYGTSVRANASLLRATWQLNTSSTSAVFQNDEIIRGSTSGARARIVHTSDTLISGSAETRYIQPLDDTDVNFNKFTVSETVTGLTSGSVGTVAAVNPPTIQPHSGTVIYVDHRQAVERTDGQAQLLHIVIEF